MAERQDDQAPDDVRYAMDETRARLSQTADQLGDALSARVGAVRDRVGAARERVNVGEMIQRHPWPALGLAIGLGVALAASGADRAAASATGGAARRATRGTKDAVRRRRERAAAERQLHPQSEGPGLIERLTNGILGAINVDALVEQLRHAGGELSTRRPAADVSTNRLSNRDYWK
ncbi:MAG TPA: hypothetical protein VEA99_18760 [Gemmatimonadaceae bacterium]|nr:hypothetical protein [Gemmatimonadaceae bacterium]